MSEVHRIPCGNVNCYLIENGDAAILVDTGRREHVHRVLEACRPRPVKLILLTHGHFDHAENAARLSNALGAPIAMSGEDWDLISSNANQTLAAETFLGKVVLSASLRDFAKRTMEVFRPQVLLRGGDSLAEYGLEAEVIALPGHTRGSIGIDVDHRYLLVGDALMNMFYPTVSMLYHSREEMRRSAERISALGERTIYFGHGKPLKNRQWIR